MRRRVWEAAIRRHVVCRGWAAVSKIGIGDRPVGGLLIAAALALAAALPVSAQDSLPVLARVGPWPVLSMPIGFQGRLWFVNSVKGRNHNSADVYSYHPGTGEVRYERHLFSQDAGDPVVAGGRLYWPFEDARFSVGWGHFLVTDGATWRLGTVPTARIFHVHAMAAAGGRLVAATSAWRAGLQVSDDGGLGWREIYDHPTADRRVSRIVELAALGDDVFGYLINRGRRRLLRLDGAAVTEAPGWPEDRAIFGLASAGGWLYGLVREADGVAVWRTDGRASTRVAASDDGRPLHDIAAGAGGLWAIGPDGPDGVLWFSPDGERWRRHRRLVGGRPHEIAIYAGEVYVTGAGDDGQGILWGPAPPAPSESAAPVAEPPARLAQRRDWAAAAVRLDRVLADPATFDGRGRALRDLVYEIAAAGPPSELLTERLGRPMPELTVSLIGGQVQVPARTLGRWMLLWGISVAGRGRVPPALIAEPWDAEPNDAEKYFNTGPAAMWAATAIGQRDRATIAALVARLGRTDDPLWLRGDVVGALVALTDRRFGYDVAAWRDWWKQALKDWPD
jgi:hypothetical protein